MREIEELIHSAKGHARHDQTETPRAMIDRVCRCQRQVVKLQSKAMGKGGRELVSCLPGWLARREVPGTGWVLWCLGCLECLGARWEAARVSQGWVLYYVLATLGKAWAAPSLVYGTVTRRVVKSSAGPSQEALTVETKAQRAS